MKLNINKEMDQAVWRALAEDQAGRDITSRLLLESKQKIEAVIWSRESGVLCGLDIARRVFLRMDPGCKFTALARDGQSLRANQKVARVKGCARGILTAERTALNFLQHLSGVATLTRAFGQKMRGTRTLIYDTRKTITGLRALQKYAVRCGGGQNHRFDLAEAAMVKDNHINILAGGRQQLMQLKRRLPKGKRLIIEAENIEQVKTALAAQADIILLDNMTLAKLSAAVRFIHQGWKSCGAGVRPQIEISGGVTLESAARYARLGADRISVGCLTHSSRALDLSMEIVK